MRGSDEPIAISADSTGVRVIGLLDGLGGEHGRRGAASRSTLQWTLRQGGGVVAMEVTTDDAHDSKFFPKLLDEARGMESVEVYGDGAFDSSEGSTSS